MKLGAIGFAACLLMLLGNACAASEFRSELPLAQWEFQPGAAITVPPRDDDWATVTLPLNWARSAIASKAGKSWQKANLRDCDNGWLQTSLTIPADWRGRTIYLKVLGLECDAVVWVNGKKVAELIGPDGQVDLTEHLTPGKPVLLRLWVTRWWVGVSNQRGDDPFRDLAIKASADPSGMRRSIPAGISKRISLAVVPQQAEIANVLVETSVREKLLKLHVDYHLRTANPGAYFQVQVMELDGETEGLPSMRQAVEGVSTPRHTGRQTLAIPWSNPRLWELGSAHLYRLKVSLLDARGVVIDEYPSIRFGFREIWTKDKQLILNGHPLRLRMAYFVTGVPQLVFFEAMGFNALEIQPNVHQWYSANGLFPRANEELLDAADERGWAVLMPAPSVNRVRDALTTTRAQERFERDLRAWMKRDDHQNRPSILMWCPSMNTASNLRPEMLGRKPEGRRPSWYDKSQQLIKAQDPTRLVYHHHGGPSGDVEMANLYLNLLPLQEREEYLSAWNAHGERPWGAIEFGPPFVANFFNKTGRVPQVTEYCAIYFGDEAYRLEQDAYVRASLDVLAERLDLGSNFATTIAFSRKRYLERLGDWTAYYRLMDLFIRRTNRSWRGWGINGGLFPWIHSVGFGDPPGYNGSNPFARYDSLTGTDDPAKERPAWANPLYDAYRDTSQALLVFLGGPPARFTDHRHNFYVGQEVEKSVVVVWDGPGKKSLKANWTFVVGDQTIQTGAETFELEAGDIIKRPIRLHMPEVAEKTPGELRVRVHASGRELSELADRMSLSIFPRPSAARLQSRWAIFDPQGASVREMGAQGINARSIQFGDDLREVDVLVIGRGALKGLRGLPFDLEDVRRGLKVLFLEQGLDELEAMGFRAQDVMPRRAFPRAAAHPALAGIDASDLSDWAGEGTLLPQTSSGMRVWPWPHAPHWGNTGSVASVVIETPHRGAFTPLVECEFDLAYSPLLEWKEGRGRVLFSQFDLAGRLGQEPAADLLLANMVRYLDSADKHEQNRQIVYFGDAAAWAQNLGLKMAEQGSVTAAQLVPARDIAVVGPDALSAMADQMADLSVFTKQGGTVVVLPQQAETLAVINASLVSNRLAKAELSGWDPDESLLRGIGPQLLHFRTFLEARTPAAVPTGSKMLLNGLLTIVPQERGRWIFSQLDWRPLLDGSANLRRTRWNLQKYYRQILTNCGVATADTYARQMLTPVRLAPLADIASWQVAINPDEIAVDTSRTQDVEGAHRKEGERVTLPALSQPLRIDQWLNRPESANRPAWRLRGVDKDGWLDFARLTPIKRGKVGYAVTQVYSSRSRMAHLAIDSDWWFILMVNGKVMVDQGKDGRVPGAPRKGEVRVRIPLRAGWNQLVMKVASGGGGFGFWCQITDPGDLRVAASLQAPATAPGALPEARVLLDEPVTTEADPLYAEPLLYHDDPYGFTPW